MTKRVLSMLLAVVTILSLAVPAFAEEPETEAEEPIVTEESVEEEAETPETPAGPAEQEPTEEPAEEEEPAEPEATEEPGETEAPTEPKEPEPTEAPAETAESEETEEPAAEEDAAPIVEDEPAAMAEPASGTCDVGLHWELSADGTLAITGNGIMQEFRETAKPWGDRSATVYGDDNIKKVVLGQGVQSVGGYAFDSYRSLTSVTLPASCLRVGDSAFFDCEILSDIDLSNVRRVGDYAFAHNYSLGTVTLSAYLDSLGIGAFSYCGLTDIKFGPNNELKVLPAIGKEAFLLHKTEEIVLPACIKTVGANAFASKGYPRTITVMNRDCVIEDCAEYFDYDSISMVMGYALGDPDATTIVGYGGSTAEKYADKYGFAFKNIETGAITPARPHIDPVPGPSSQTTPPPTPAPDAVVRSGSCGAAQPEDVTWQLDREGTLFIAGSGAMADYEKSGSNVPETPWNKDGGAGIRRIVVEPGVTHIGDWAFSMLYEAGSVYIPSSVTSIGDGAFFNDMFSSVRLPNGLQTIGADAFASCAMLKKVTIPASVTSIGDRAFAESWLSELTVEDGDSPLYIGIRAFSGTNLAAADLPQRVYSINTGAFDECLYLERVTVRNRSCTIALDAQRTDMGAAETWETLGVPGQTVVEGHDNSTAASYASGSGFTFRSLETGAETAPPPVQPPYGGIIKYSGVCGAPNLYDVTWKYSMLTGTLTISGSGRIRNYTEKSLPPWYDYRTIIDKIVVEDGITNIGDFAFFGLDAEQVYLPQSVEIIGESAFAVCKNLKKLTLPSNMTLIGRSAFIGCSALERVTMPAQCGMLSDGAFFSCTSLRSIRIPDGVVKVGEDAFADCHALKAVTFGKDVADIGPWAFKDCSIRTITLPANIKTIGARAFQGCPLTEITVQNKNCKICTSGKGSSTQVDALGDPEYTVVYGHEGSTAETFAKKWGFAFRGIGYLDGTPKVLEAVNVVGGVKISWAGVDEADRYRVYYKTGTGGWKTAGDTVMAETAYIWTGAKSGTKYTFTVRCIDEDGNVTSLCDSTGKSIRYIARPAFSAKNAATGISVSWGKVTGAAKYRVFYRQAGGEWTKITDTTKTSCTWTGAVSGTGYDIRVQAIASDGTLSSGEDRGVSILYLAQPKISSAVNTTEGVKLTWSKVSGVQSYELLYKAGKGAWTHLADIAAEAEAVYEWKEPVIGTKYAFTVKSTAQGAASSYNTTGVSLTYLAAPAVKSVEGVSSGIKISWGKVSGAAKYRVYYASSLKEDGTPAWKKLTDVSKSKDAYTWKKAKYGVKYYFTVGCVDSKGKKATSAKFETGGDYITLLAAPSVTLANTPEGVKISWKAVTNAVKYTVTVNGEEAAVTDTTYLYDRAVNNTKYTVTVQSLGADERTLGKVSAAKSIAYLNAPQIAEIKASSNGIKITWEKVDGAAKYRVYYATKLDTDGTPVWKKLANTGSTSYNWKKAKPDTPYYFTVVCMDKKYKKATSAKYDTADNAFTLLKTPSPKAAVAKEGIDLSWTAIEGAAQYQVTVKQGKTEVKKEPVTEAAYSFTEVASGKKYTFTVQAQDAAGKPVSKVSSAKSATYIAPPKITATSAANGIQVKWDKVPGAAKYRVYYKDGDSWKKIADTKSVSYLWKKAISGTTYEIAVRCVDSKGKKATSELSDSATATYTKA